MKPLVFTAAEIAAAIGRRRENVARSLNDLPISGSKLVHGNVARAWSVDVLPESMRSALEEQARRNGCRDAAEYLRQSGSPWEPALPWVKCHVDAIAEAQKLFQALRPSFGWDREGLTAGEIEARGLELYQRVFGHSVTARHWRNLRNRTLWRAGTIHSLDKPELYLPERPKARTDLTPGPKAEPDDAVAQRLTRCVGACSDPANLSPRERESLWTEAMECHDTLLLEGVPTSRAGRRIRSALLEIAPWISANPAALQKTYLRRLEAWRKCGARAMADGRRDSDRDAYELPEADRNVITNLAVWQFPGHIAAAWRAAHERGLLTPETVARYPLAANKSHVPSKVREAVAAEVKIFRKMKLHQRSASDLVPHLSRSYEGIHSCDSFNFDDVTLPVYCFVPDGAGWFNLVRGQCLLAIDFRSLKIIGWSFQQDPNYSSLVIRTLCTRIFSELCVPKILSLEKGVWEKSVLITGRKPALSNEDVAHGLREFGCDFNHSIRPRAKPVERVIGLVQDLMEAEPGYCGRDERRDLPAHTKQAMDDVKFHRRHPSELFYSFSQWHDRLAQIISRYNATVQQGEVLDGLSPNQAFDQFMNHEDPPMQFGPEHRYLLAHHKEEREVKTSGLQLKVGKNVFRYYGPELGHLVGRRVLAWFDAENPDALVVTDLDRRNPILVPRADKVPALASLVPGGDEELAAGIARAEGQMAHLRARYNVIKGAAPLPHRTVLAGLKTADTGAKISRLREENARKQRVVDKNRRLAKEMGFAIPENRLADEETARAMRDIDAFIQENHPEP